ncbi:hypothetical protein [Methylotuvimicrobium buryatense]|uniref:Uncharacterized protein n=1 Tax=Methylotuvimicrobium buryatense TaxID=95641 RepID=A0A4P9URL0_METBY|nr:hypothetical protein [Methylotuvimicrobium buryatense]QCW84132.1 hypothetical protein EQU24_19235 [Methylotuvimicrobium buryatense]
MYLFHKAAKIILLLRHNLATTIIVLLFGIVIFKLIGAYISSNIDDGEWAQFKIDHDCQPFINDSGSQRLSWQCDDGKVYYRWRQQR